MRKIPTLFKRDENDQKQVTSEVTPECIWVLDGEGAATRKYDGTCCLVKDGQFFKRYELRHKKVDGQWDEAAHPSTPDGWLRADGIDANTGKQPGWAPVGDGPEDRWHKEAWRSWELTEGTTPPDGTYELVGPKVQGNPEGYSAHVLINHATETAFDDATPEPPRDYDGLREWMLTVASEDGYEGIVWHHPDGRMAKLKKRDFA